MHALGSSHDAGSAAPPISSIGRFGCSTAPSTRGLMTPSSSFPAFGIATRGSKGGVYGLCLVLFFSPSRETDTSACTHLHRNNVTCKPSRWVIYRLSELAHQSVPLMFFFFLHAICGFSCIFFPYGLRALSLRRLPRGHLFLSPPGPILRRNLQCALTVLVTRFSHEILLSSLSSFFSPVSSHSTAPNRSVLCFPCAKPESLRFSPLASGEGGTARLHAHLPLPRCAARRFPPDASALFLCIHTPQPNACRPKRPSCRSSAASLQIPLLKRTRVRKVFVSTSAGEQTCARQARGGKGNKWRKKQKKYDERGQRGRVCARKKKKS